MFRPSLFNSVSRRAIGRNLALDLVVAVGMGVTMALVNAILPTVARRGGLEPLGLSALRPRRSSPICSAPSPAGSDRATPPS